MGSAQSTSVKQSIQVVNEAMTNLVTINSTRTTARNSNINSANVTFGENARPLPGIDPNKCGLNISQSINPKQSVKVMAKFENLNDMKTQITNALKSKAEASNDSTQGALATALSVQNSKTSINQAITNMVNTNVKTENLNEVNSFLDNLNDGIFEFKGFYPCPIVINQSIISDQIVSMLSDAVVGNKISNITDNSASADSKNNNSSKQQGLVDALSGLISSGAFAIIAPLVLILIIGIIVKVVISKSGGSGVKLNIPSTNSAINSSIKTVQGFGRIRRR